MPRASASPSHCSRKRKLRFRQISLCGLLGWTYAPLVAVERSSNARGRAGLDRGYQRTQLRALEWGTITQEQAAAKINEVHEIWRAANGPSRPDKRFAPSGDSFSRREPARLSDCRQGSPFNCTSMHILGRAPHIPSSSREGLDARWRRRLSVSQLRDPDPQEYLMPDEQWQACAGRSAERRLSTSPRVVATGTI